MNKRNHFFCSEVVFGYIFFLLLSYLTGDLSSTNGKHENGSFINVCSHCYFLLLLNRVFLLLLSMKVQKVIRYLPPLFLSYLLYRCDISNYFICCQLFHYTLCIPVEF